jgi:hypothetical protein
MSDILLMITSKLHGVSDFITYASPVESAREYHPENYVIRPGISMSEGIDLIIAYERSKL